MLEKPKIILSSDAHWGEKKYDELTDSKFRSKEERVEDWIPDAVLIDEVFERWRQGAERRFELLLKEMQRVGDAKYLFFGGDMVSGYGERGLSGPNSLEAIKNFKEVLDSLINPKVSRKYVAGGHELGYYLPWSWDKSGGINEKSIEMFEGNFNKLFYTFQEEQYKFVILSSDLELITSDMRGGTDAILKKKEEQQTFYKDTIAETKSSERVVLMMHDPDALNPMFSFLEQHLNKIEKTFVGHHHAQWIITWQRFLYSIAATPFDSKIMQILRREIKQFTGEDSILKFLDRMAEENKNVKHLVDYRENAKIWQQVKLVTIPAPGGRFGIGGKFLVGRLGEDELEIQEHSVPVNYGPITLPIDHGLITGK